MIIRHVLGMRFWRVQREIAVSVFTNRRTTVRSCHASGKSYEAAGITLAWLLKYPYSSAVLTTAPTWRQVEKVIWREISAAYKHANVTIGGKLNLTELMLDDKWLAVGISTNDPDRFSGFHAEHLLVIKDESSGIPEDIHDAIEGVASTGHVSILEIGNPTDPVGHFAKTFKSPYYTKFHISCFDTPNFKPWCVRTPGGSVDIEKSIEAFRLSTDDERSAAITHPFLISPQWVFERMTEWGTESPMFLARCLGTFPKEGDDTLFPLRYVEAAVEKWRDNQQLFKEGKETMRLGNQSDEALGVDVARFGGDKTVFVHRIGNNVESIIKYEKADTMLTAQRVHEFAKVHPYAKINVDDVGVGGGVTDRLRQLGLNVNAINVSQAPKNPDLYTNLRAELYFELSQLFETGVILIPDDEGLQGELTSIKYKVNRSKILIESKDEIKKRGLSSPDTADALMLSFASSSANALVDFYKDQIRNNNGGQR